MIKHKEDVFLREIDILGRCKHPNIQSFIGFYDEGSTKMLFYVYNSFKFLHQFLNDANLTWEIRLKICIDVANGLDYLHNKMEDQKMVIHGDINSENIELDDIWGAKIVGFEKSGMFHSETYDHVTRRFEGDPGDLHYPEYGMTDELTKISDIFSFGIVMMEILCGTCILGDFHKNDLKKVVRQDLEELSLHWLQNGTIKGKLSPVVWEYNCGNNYSRPNKDSLNTFIDIIYKCLRNDYNNPLEMKVVVKELHKALSFQRRTPHRRSYSSI
ncbi:probable serine/threonine-protein kinase At1g01540 [Rutidosis leptorrhynchoides]|uniref:probable serine/threonine-protein kinase At1g01540 n=1 Tax=Rutidosis leptorrhynchoides TaxID=125765 RepID=UPI003A994882